MLHYSHMIKIISWLSIITAVVSVVAVAGIIGAEIYVRWKVNQNFTFLGGDSLAALIIASFGLVLGLSFVHRHTGNR
jgi:hypothetical protein